MYFVDFFKQITKKSNIGVLIWLILNTIIVTFVLGAIFGGKFLSFLMGFVVYVGLLALTLSPFGEAILRRQNGCVEVKDPAILSRIQPLFQEIYGKAKLLNPELPDDIKFYLCEDDEPNAFATGRRTVCMTRGLLSYSDRQIKAILAHEFGHLAHKDTDAILIIEVGNMVVSAFFVIYRFFFHISAAFCTAVIGAASEGIGTRLAEIIMKFFIDVVMVAMMQLWTKLGVLICLHSSRKNENEADTYALQLGYGEELCGFLDGLPASHAKGLWAALNSTHPDNDVRIAYLQQLGCPYEKRLPAAY